MASSHALVAIASPCPQRGVVTMFISMVMLILITIMVIAAYALSTTNLRVVGNVQAREEAVAAANFVIERILLEEVFYEVPKAQPKQPVHINGDESTVPDYLVDVAIPVCVRATQAGTTASSSVDLPGMTTSGAFDTIWELDATATATATGAKVRVVQGVRVLLSETDKDSLCDV